MSTMVMASSLISLYLLGLKVLCSVNSVHLSSPLVIESAWYYCSGTEFTVAQIKALKHVWD